jgi:hypothetical protein
MKIHAGRPTLVAFMGFCAALLFHLAEVSQGIGNTLEGPHDFRQSQTAISTYYLSHEGLRIDYETPVFGSPSSIPFEFPTYQFAVVGVHKLLGLRLDLAGRITNLFFFYASLPLVILTLRRLQLPWPGIWLASAAILVSPVYIFYSRAFLIESTALFFSWIFVLATTAVLCREPREDSARSELRCHRTLLFVAMLAGIIAAVTKITTFAVHAAAVILLWLAFHHEKLGRALFASEKRRRLWPGLTRLAAIFGLILPVAWLWVRHTDTIKLLNPSPIVQRLTSSALRDWNFGYAGQLLQPGTWRGLYSHFLNVSMGSFFPLGISLFLCTVLRRDKSIIVAFVLALLGGPALFTNLYFIHDYYWYANTLFFSIACGLTLGAFLLENFAPSAWVKPLVIVLVFVTAQGFAYHYSGYHLVQRVPPTQGGRIAAIVKGNTDPQSGILVFGFDWNPLIPYYAERRAFMVPWDNELYFTAGSQQALFNLARAGHMIDAIVFGGATMQDESLQRRVLASLPYRFDKTYKDGEALVLVRSTQASPRGQ